MRKRSTARNWTEYLAFRFALASMRWTPVPMALALGRLYARLFDICVPRLRRVARRNLALAMPEFDAAQHERIIDGVFASIGRILTLSSRFPAIGPHNVERWIRYEGFEHFEEARRRGKGVLFATAHLGNWELSAFAHAHMTEPMHVIVRPLDNPLIDSYVTRLRESSGNRMIGKKDLIRSMLRALAGNKAVGILIDQNASPEEGVFINFFGVPACAHAGFVRIAARSGAAVIPGFALWSETERRYVLRFYPPIEMTGETLADTQRLHRRLEQVIREHPDQWLWIHRRWKTRPPGEPSLY